MANQSNFLNILQNEYHQMKSKQEGNPSEILEKSENRDKQMTINVNYVNGFEDHKKYICIQSLNKNTLEGFYSILRREHISIIVMLTGSTETSENQCYQYWSETAASVFQTGQFKMRTVKTKAFPNFVVTELHLINGFGQARQICHFAYSDRSKSNIPNDVAKFYQFVMKVNHIRTKSKQAADIQNFDLGLLVHSTNQTDLSSMFCATDFALYQIVKTAWVSLPKIVKSIEHQLHSSIIPFV